MESEICPHKAVYCTALDTKDSLDVNILTAKDIVDICNAVDSGMVDYIAVPFVESKQDLDDVRDDLGSRGCNIKILAKIQNKRALKNIDEILENSDGIMIARG